MAEKSGEKASQVSSRTGRTEGRRAGQVVPQHPLLELQQVVGNQAVERLLRAGSAQAKLNPGQPDDAYERGADSLAQQVTARASLPALQRACAPSKPVASCPQCQTEEEGLVQRKLDQVSPAHAPSVRGDLAPPPTYQRLLDSLPAMQFKLTVNQPGDRYEQEADRVAERVMRMPRSRAAKEPAVSGRAQGLRIQRRCKTCEDEAPRRIEEEQGIVQAKTAPGHTPQITADQELEMGALRGNGQPLPPSVRAFFEPRFGHDFSQVRVHTDARALRLARATNARAFTVGHDIIFGAGEYAPGTEGGRLLLAHELTHTIQQQGHTPTREPRPASNHLEGAHARTSASLDGAVGQGQPGLLAPAPSAPVNAPTLQRQAAAPAPAITEAEARGLLDAEEQQDRAEISEEETQALTGSGTEPPPGSIENEVGTVPAEEETEEIEIPEFDANTGDECPQLIPEEVEEPAVGAEPQESSQEGFFSTLLSYVPSALRGPLGLLSGVASWLWRQLPLSTRAAAVNRGIDAAIEVLANLPGRQLVGQVWGWLQAGLTAFLRRLRRLGDEEKVAIFEKMGSLILGGNLSYMWGFVKGLVKGFFIDGLVGIVQMIVDLVCLVPKVGRFIEALGRFFTSLPEEMAAAFNAIRALGTAVGAAIRGAASEFLDMLRNPQRLVALLDTVYAAGESMAREIGERIAEEFITFFRQSVERIGERVGRVVGQLVFEGALAYVTAGGGAAITGAKVAVRAVVRIMGQIGRRVFQVIRLLGRALDRARDLVVAVRRYLTRLFRTVADKLYQALEWILDFFHSFGRYCRPGSVKCRVPRRRRQPPRRSPKCQGRFVPRLGGFRPHDLYTARVTRRASDFRIVLGPVLRCTYDAKVSRELFECKTGYGWLQNPTVQSQPWFPWALARLDAQRYRCLITASRCGYLYRWYMQNAGAAAYLNARWRGIPPVLHRP